MTPGDGLYFKPFDERLRLVEVIAGARCCIGWKRSLAETTSGLPGTAKLIKARLSFRQFKVCTQLSEGSAPRGFHAEWAWKICTLQGPKSPCAP